MPSSQEPEGRHLGGHTPPHGPEGRLLGGHTPPRGARGPRCLGLSWVPGRLGLSSGTLDSAHPADHSAWKRPLPLPPRVPLTREDIRCDPRASHGQCDRQRTSPAWSVPTAGGAFGDGGGGTGGWELLPPLPRTSSRCLHLTDAKRDREAQRSSDQGRAGLAAPSPPSREGPPRESGE